MDSDSKIPADRPRSREGSSGSGGLWARDTLSRLLDDYLEEEDPAPLPPVPDLDAVPSRESESPHRAPTEPPPMEPLPAEPPQEARSTRDRFVIDGSPRKTTKFNPSRAINAWMEEHTAVGDERSAVGPAPDAPPELDEIPVDSQEESSTIIGDRYLLEEGLARGGMGAVFKVLHRTLQKRFALKIMHPGKANRQGMIKSFFQEAQILSRLDHPNIVGVIDFGLDEAFGTFLVMEYLKGETLHSRLGRGKGLHLRLALQVGLQVAEALQYLHQQELVHRDIKPENIFICRVPQRGRRRFQVKIIDFGLARPHVSNAVLNASERGGTPEFIAPEVLGGAAPTPSMDIYAVGVLMFEMITGVNPFSGSLREIVRQKTHSEVPRPSKYLDSPLDSVLERTIRRAMSVDPAQRQRSMSDVVYELRTITEMLGIAEPRGRVRPQASHGTELEGRPADREHEGLSLMGSPVPTCIITADQRISAANEPFGEILRLPPTEIHGRLISETRLAAVLPGIGDDVRGVLDSRAPVQRQVTVDTNQLRATVHISLVPYRSQPDKKRAVWCSVLLVGEQHAPEESWAEFLDGAPAKD